MQIPQGRSNSPGPEPFPPNLRKNTPEDENTYEVCTDLRNTV